MSLQNPSLSKQQRIQVWREEVAASASLCTCPPSSPAASASSTNISLSAASSSGSSSASSPGAGDAFTFPRSDMLPSQPTHCAICSRLGAPPAMGLDPLAAYLDQAETLPGGHAPAGIFRAKHGSHPIFRGMRNLVRKLSGSRTGGPMPPRGADEATKMYRRVTLAAPLNVKLNDAADAELDAEGDCVVDDAESDGRGRVSKLIAEKQARLRRAERLLVRTHGGR
ncbi:hypothetical protein LZ32DRAFT_59446 [Colletotrichum eremochloae]|uniref:Uncharacterized protein n=1 Tax=Colletotrichum sublineola TaxID=1173701 RepID=A0A066X6Z7_COLSU|nr:hypothetical protein LY78DRAFT_308632 [Colletotrichum sublineola]KAK2007199.1 hypothetical protein LZ32DRAFT_59446 [Colletotrichum eremochloae]KDN63454.1 hypothetical protein CSUB01_04563 [Colletotrichum sublineola]